MNPVRLRTLLAVAETGSINRAAKRMGCSRAAAARLLEELAAEVGTDVVTVSRRGASLTAAGQSLAARAPALIQRAAALQRELISPGELPGLFRFALPIGLAPPMVSRICTFGAKLFGRWHHRIDTFEDPLAALRTGTVDLALVLTEVEEGPWLTSRVTTLSEHLAAAPSYLAQHGEPKSLGALAQHRLLVWQRPGRSPGELPLLDGGRHPVVPFLTGNDAWLLHGMAERGTGIACTLWGPLEDHERLGPKPVRILGDVVGRPCPLHVVLREGAAPRLSWRALLNSARALFRHT